MLLFCRHSLHSPYIVPLFDFRDLQHACDLDGLLVVYAPQRLSHCLSERLIRTALYLLSFITPLLPHLLCPSFSSLSSYPSSSDLPYPSCKPQHTLRRTQPIPWPGLSSISFPSRQAFYAVLTCHLWRGLVSGVGFQGSPLM